MSLSIFSTINMAKSIAAYLGLIESVDRNIQRLLHQAFRGATENLQYAKSSSGANQLDYIKRARDKFIDAVAVEQDENLISSLLGLSMCQHLLGDTANSKVTFERIKSVKLSRQQIAGAAARDGLRFMIPLYGIYRMFTSQDSPLSDSLGRVEAFNEYKQMALATK